MRYLTPARFRVMGSGVDLEGVSDTELASHISRAEDLVDTFCNVPSLPQRYDFRGGSITDETHAFSPGQIRVFPTHKPVREVISFQVYATNDVYVDIDPQDLFIEPRGGWLEIVALSMSPVGFWAASGLISISRPVLKLDYEYGWSFQVRNEVLATDDDALYRSQNQFWDLDTEAPVIKKNGTVVSSGITIDPIEGTVLFDSTPLLTDTITADYTHSLPSAIPQAVAIIVGSGINESSLVAKGLGNLAEIQVEEVRLRRDARRTGTMVVAETVPPAAQALLIPYRFISQ
jgi:hypothetical protein